jgi:hypothetical protein
LCLLPFADSSRTHPHQKTTPNNLHRMFQMDAQEMEQKLKEDPNYIPTLEDEVEAQRQIKVAELKASGKGTPVTPETFAAWKESKRKRKAEEEKKLVEAELKKKKGGKGLSVLSGRALYEYKRDLFLDDEAATEGLEFGDQDDEDENQTVPRLDDVAEKGDEIEIDEVVEKVQTLL